MNVYPRFSPDSRRIAYLHQERGLNSLWVVNIDGSGRRRVVQEENDSSPDHFCWSPDGKSLAYKIEDWQRDENGKKFLGGSEESRPRIAIIDDEGKNSRHSRSARRQVDRRPRLALSQWRRVSFPRSAWERVIVHSRMNRSSPR